MNKNIEVHDYHPSKRMKRCSVRFSQESDTIISPYTFNNDVYYTNIDETDSEGISTLFYSRNELHDIRKSVQAICDNSIRINCIKSSNSERSSAIIDSAIMQQQQQQQSQSSFIQSNSLDYSSEARGLEKSLCKDRRQCKYLTIKIILQAAMKFQYDNDDHLSSSAKRCTEWATTIATDEGFRDFCRAYDIPMNDILSSPPSPYQ